MAMSVGGGGADEPMMDINTTPLIDVMLVLLIMFIITLPVMTHAVKLDMPRTNTQPQNNEVQIEPIRIDIDWDGSVIWNGNLVQLDQLESYFRTEAARNPQPELHVRPERRANYDTVAKVLALAQRNGMQRIGFVGNEQFMGE
ncbi:biopolymer transporter ExbD [Steroidobacter sp. S1-65]|uniref:Biopolymer transporter ExbD n=1 Tax=Steroidobacter gossypii TaxID=2805490 RepID=A0ABS1X5H2_9GAMM|nr:biopolymer transporter ExbD [Steroidobacter gossypii]MBM0108479.1 biopolymer transporter ExbD [Steroidobacter gossypii]